MGLTKQHKKVFTIGMAIGLLLASSVIFLQYERNNFTRLSVCKLTGQENGNMIFKQTLGTFDPSEYGVNVYVVASPRRWEEIISLAEEYNVSLDENIRLTFEYNRLFGLEQKSDSTYFKIGRVISVEQADSLPIL